MKKGLSVFIIVTFAAALCISGCTRGSSTAPKGAGAGVSGEAETRRYDAMLSPSAKSIDLSGIESTISFDSLDLSGADRIFVQLAYSDSDEYSYWIEDGDTVARVSDMVKEIEGEGLFYPQGIFELEACVTFYSGDSELFYIGLGKNYFESGSKICDNIEGLAEYSDGYYYGKGNPEGLLGLLLKPEWKEAGKAGAM